MLAAVSLLLAAVLVGQALAPLRKTDLVWLLSGSALSQGELAQLVSRNCLTFDPTNRDRTDFRRLGAEPAVLAALDNCARRTAAARRAAAAAPPTPHTQPTDRGGSPAPPVSLPPPRTRAVFSARSGFVAGGGQRGPARSRLPRAVVFEARDSLGTPVAGVEVAFEGINARTEPATATTDGTGQTRVVVILGDRAGYATVIASIGMVEKQVAFGIAAGPAAQLVVTCGGANVPARLAMRPDTVVVLRVTAVDGFANAAPLLGLRAAVADARIFRVLRVTQDSLAGTVALKPDQPGTTSLAVIANGLRQYLTVTVPPKAAPGKVDCR